MLLDHLNYESLLVPLNLFYDLATGGKRRPVFFSIPDTYPSLLELDRGFPVIREELLAILPDKRAIPKYHELDEMQRPISARVDPEKDWKVYPLNLMGISPAGYSERCPRTMALLDGIPGLFQAFFSILEGGKSIPAHEGPYRGYLRYHLGLVVPAQDPPSIRLKDQHYTWQEGQSVLFDDSWNHEVFNKCSADRVILIVDVRRPMPWVFDAVNRLVQAIMKPVYGKQIVAKLPPAPPAPARPVETTAAKAAAAEASHALAGESQ
jgi:aspartyl/asparaginyl beta-hydroxylase (cupin superfamily)